eukprot:3574444-Rhodomonas_salina.1
MKCAVLRQHMMLHDLRRMLLREVLYRFSASCYAMRSTDLRYGAMVCGVLIYGMVLCDAEY